MSQYACSDLWIRLKDWEIAAVIGPGACAVKLLVYVRLTANSATAWIRVMGLENCARATVKGSSYDRATAAVYKAALLANKGDKPCADAQPFLDVLIDGDEMWQERLAEECENRPGFGFLNIC
jgi:hypothetical protein